MDSSGAEIEISHGLNVLSTTEGYGSKPHGPQHPREIVVGADGRSAGARRLSSAAN